MLVCDVFAKHNEWYCKVADDKFQICRKCIDLNKDCDKEPRTECKCENWKFTNFDCKWFFSLIQGTPGLLTLGVHPQFLADQLTLSQLRGADNAHKIILYKIEIIF